jgi:hypothetical protein
MIQIGCIRRDCSAHLYFFNLFESGFEVSSVAFLRVFFTSGGNSAHALAQTDNATSDPNIPKWGIK